MNIGFRDKRCRPPDYYLYAQNYVTDHNVPTDDLQRCPGISEPENRRLQVETLEQNAVAFGIPYLPLQSLQQGIAHIVGPELSLTLPDMTIVCGVSHTSTHGAFGALAFGIRTSESSMCSRPATLLRQPARSMFIRVDNRLTPRGHGQGFDPPYHWRDRLGRRDGHVIEYAGEAVIALDMPGRMTLCNMSIEAGARASLIAPDDKTFSSLARTPYAPRRHEWDRARAYWQTRRSGEGATFDRIVVIDGQEVGPMVTWGTSPEAMITMKGRPRRKDWTPVHGSRLRMATTGLLHVPWDEPGSTEAGSALRLHLQSQLRGPPGTGGRTHLMSPAMAATALTGRLVDARRMQP